MFDAQAWFARDFILGKIAMPSKADMETEFNAWREREGTLEGDEENIRFQVGNSIRSQYKNSIDSRIV